MNNPSQEINTNDSKINLYESWFFISLRMLAVAISLAAIVAFVGLLINFGDVYNSLNAAQFYGSIFGALLISVSSAAFAVDPGLYPKSFSFFCCDKDKSLEFIEPNSSPQSLSV